jgi:hypothetical protein
MAAATRGSPARRASAGAVGALAMLVAALLSSAAGHGTTIPHDLVGVSFCVDDATLRVAFEGDEGGRLAAIVAERIERSLVATFDAAALPWRRVALCPAERGYVELGLDVRAAPWFGARAVEYDAVVRVGWRATGPEGVRALPPDAFDFAVTDLFDEAAVRIPAFVFLPRYLEAGLRDLSVSWWEDRAASPEEVPRWVPMAGVALAVLVALLAALTVGTLRRRSTPFSATAFERPRPYHQV